MVLVTGKFEVLNKTHAAEKNESIKDNSVKEQSTATKPAEVAAAQKAPLKSAADVLADTGNSKTAVPTVVHAQDEDDKSKESKQEAPKRRIVRRRRA